MLVIYFIQQCMGNSLRRDKSTSIDVDKFELSQSCFCYLCKELANFN